MSRMSFSARNERGFSARRKELVDDFASWLEPLSVSVDPYDFGLLLEHKWQYGDGRLDRWRRSDLSAFLLDWCPRQLTASENQYRTVPATVALSMSFLLERGLLDEGSDRVDQLVEHAMGQQAEFEEVMSDPAQFGLAKSIFAHLDLDDPTSLSPEALDAAIAGFNQLPLEQRRAVTDGPIERRHAAQPLPIGPVTLPTTEAVRASAEAAPVLAQFDALAAYLAAPGKPLTARGNLRLADARQLSELLQTSDKYEESYGDGQVWRKHTATQFVELDHWQWWAREAGAVRKVGNKLVGVKAWQQRRVKDPVAAVRRAFAVLMEFGPVSAYWQHRLDDLGPIVDASVGPFLGRLLESGGPVAYDELSETWTTLLDGMGPTWHPGTASAHLDMLVTLLERCGVVTQRGAVHTPGRFGQSIRSGGTVELTPLGTVLGLELLADQDVDVDVLPPPEQLGADELAELFARLDPPGWWTAFGRWLDHQADSDEAVGAVVEALAGQSVVALLLVLGTAPEQEHPRIAPRLTALAQQRSQPLDEIGALALDWLDRHERLDDLPVDPATVRDAYLVSLGVLAKADPVVGASTFAQDRSPADQLGLIGVVGQRLPPRAVPLLEALGQQLPDKVVAKAARKELFRVRSKLLSRERQT